MPLGQGGDRRSHLIEAYKALIFRIYNDKPDLIPVAISLDLTVPAFAAQSGPRITPKGGVSFYANGYHTG